MVDSNSAVVFRGEEGDIFGAQDGHATLAAASGRPQVVTDRGEQCAATDSSARMIASAGWLPRRVHAV